MYFKFWINSKDKLKVIPSENVVKGNFFTGSDLEFIEVKDKNTFDSNIKINKNILISKDLVLNSDAVTKRLPDFEMFSVPDMGRQEIEKEDVPAVFNNGLLLLVGSNNASSNGVITKLDASARVVDGRTLVPVRYISEAFGQNVNWNAETQTVNKSVHWDDSGLIVITDKETTLSKEDALKLVEILKG